MLTSSHTTMYLQPRVNRAEAVRTSNRTVQRAVDQTPGLVKLFLIRISAGRNYACLLIVRIIIIQVLSNSIWISLQIRSSPMENLNFGSFVNTNEIYFFVLLWQFFNRLADDTIPVSIWLLTFVEFIYSGSTTLTIGTCKIYCLERIKISLKNTQNLYFPFWRSHDLSQQPIVQSSQ